MVSKNIRKIREAHGLSQEEFAANLGVSSGVITNIEYNRLQAPEKKMPLFKLISDRFNVPLDWILADDPGPIPLPEVPQDKKIIVDAGETFSDPVIKSFAEFWSQRTDKEREQLSKAIDDFYEILQKNREE